MTVDQIAIAGLIGGVVILLICLASIVLKEKRDTIEW